MARLSLSSFTPFAPSCEILCHLSSFRRASRSSCEDSKELYERRHETSPGDDSFDNLGGASCAHYSCISARTLPTFFDQHLFPMEALPERPSRKRRRSSSSASLPQDRRRKSPPSPTPALGPEAQSELQHASPGLQPHLTMTHNKGGEKEVKETMKFGVSTYAYTVLRLHVSKG